MDVELATGKGTLADLRDAINTADMNVTASILKTGIDLRACFKGARGRGPCNENFATEDTGAAGLANFAYTTPNNSVQTIAAANASFDMDGVTITRETNEVTDLIKGITLTVKSTTSAAETISGTYDATLAEAAMQIMVDQINTMSTTLRDLQNAARLVGRWPSCWRPVCNAVKTAIEKLHHNTSFRFAIHRSI